VLHGVGGGCKREVVVTHKVGGWLCDQPRFHVRQAALHRCPGMTECELSCVIHVSREERQGWRNLGYTEW